LWLGHDSGLFTPGCREGFFEQMTVFLPTTLPMPLFTQSCDQLGASD